MRMKDKVIDMDEVRYYGEFIRNALKTYKKGKPISTNAHQWKEWKYCEDYLKELYEKDQKELGIDISFEDYLDWKSMTLTMEGY